MWIITSDMYRVEVFGPDNPDASKVAEQFEACPYFEIVPLRTLAYEIAGKMRQRCLEAKPTRKLKTPDALHVASGTIARTKEIWTTAEKPVNYHESDLLTQVKVCLNQGCADHEKHPDLCRTTEIIISSDDLIRRMKREK